jgi:hypothetical protein
MGFGGKFRFWEMILARGRNNFYVSAKSRNFHQAAFFRPSESWTTWPPNMVQIGDFCPNLPGIEPSSRFPVILYYE